MILQPKQTTLAYRCPDCGGAVFSAVGVFSLTADMLKLKCSCKKSEMSVLYGKDGKVRMTVPCMICGKPHSFTVSSSLFFEKELFTLSCPYSGFTLAAMGEENAVKAEMARSELELLDFMEKSGIKNFNPLPEGEKILSDPQIQDIVMFVINDMDAEGKIYCKCSPEDNERSYDAEITDDGILVTCKKCHAKACIPTDSNLSAHAFLTADCLHLL